MKSKTMAMHIEILRRNPKDRVRLRKFNWTEIANHFNVWLSEVSCRQMNTYAMRLKASERINLSLRFLPADNIPICSVINFLWGLNSECDMFPVRKRFVGNLPYTFGDISFIPVWNTAGKFLSH